MVQDKSNDFIDTWDFLETRLGDIKDLNKIYAEVRGTHVHQYTWLIYTFILVAQNVAESCMKCMHLRILIYMCTTDL